MRHLASFTLMFFLSANVWAANPPNEEVKAQVRKATGEYNLGQYVEAARDYEAAYLQTLDPNLLFNVAQSFRLAGDTDKAITAYRSYLRSNPRGEQRALAEGKLRRARGKAHRRRAGSSGGAGRSTCAGARARTDHDPRTDRHASSANPGRPITRSWRGCSEGRRAAIKRKQCARDRARVRAAHIRAFLQALAVLGSHRCGGSGCRGHGRLAERSRRQSEDAQLHARHEGVLALRKQLGIVGLGLSVAMMASAGASCGSSKKAGIILNVSTAANVDWAAIVALQVTVDGRTQSYDVATTSTWSLGIETSAGSKSIAVQGMADSPVTAPWQGTVEAVTGQVAYQDVELLALGTVPLDGGSGGSQGPDGASSDSPTGSGGAFGNDGAIASGGGSPGSGGAPGFGGAAGVGGLPGTGGHLPGSGAAQGTGGLPGLGGVLGTGGLPETGGVLGTGGLPEQAEAYARVARLEREASSSA